MDYLGTVGPSPGTNFTTRFHRTKGNDFVGARACLTEHGTDRGKGLIMLGATVHMDRGLNGGVEYDVC